MADPITVSESEVLQFRQDVRNRLKRRVLEAFEIVLEEELVEVLGTGRYERTGSRCGYRNGAERRRVTTANGVQEIRVPRARLQGPDGSTTEHRSALLPRYARRTREVDEVILGSYLAGANSRRIRKALGPLLGEENLSKSAISRIVGRLKGLFRDWCGRDLSAESYPILFLDGFHLKVRLARRVVSAPVLAVLGVTPAGDKHLVALGLSASEAATHWGALIDGLRRRGLRAPLLLVSDGHGGLKKAVAAWPGVKVQRCTFHKWQNLAAHCPAHARRELRRDYQAIVCARDGLAARSARNAFLAKWAKLCPAVARSLEEAGEQLLTFYEFPREMWKTLRSTNALENLNREFRRRTKTQGSFGTEEAGVTLLYGLVAFGQIRMRKIDGHRQLGNLLEKEWTQAA